MPEITVTVLDEDMPMLDGLARDAFRVREGQASYLLQRALRSTRANTPERTQRAPRRTPARGNGVVRVEA